MISDNYTFIDYLLMNQTSATALIDKSGKLSYKDLNELSNGIAIKLEDSGVGEGDIIPVLLTKGIDYVAAIIGIMKSGAAFVPLDVNYPNERVRSITNSVASKLIIDNEWMESITPSDKFINRCSTDNLAFIIFTSGSAGQPKGVCVNHKALIERIRTTSSICESTKEGGNAIVTNFCFSACMDELFTSILLKQVVHILPDEIIKNINLLYKYLSTNQISSLGANPNLVKLLVDNYELPAISIRMMGDKCVGPFPKINGSYYNSYGCSEMGYSIFYHFQNAAKEFIPIGLPLDSVHAYIVDDNCRELKNNEIGELCLTGPQMASGYWNMPELTANKFVHCPFLPGDVKMFKTGDRARFRKDGNIELFGRMDFQIKVRGFRIEPGEIENVAINYDGVEYAVVVAKEIGNSIQLVLYYTSRLQIDESKLKGFLSRYLPDYMVPNFYMKLHKFPRNANNKVDRISLSKTEDLQNYVDSYERNAGGLQNTIFNICADLGLINIDCKTDFWRSGADSFFYMQCSEKLRRYGIEVSPVAIQKAGCIDNLVSLIISCESTNNENAQLNHKPQLDISFYQRRIVERDYFRYVCGLLVRWKTNLKYSIARYIARRNGAIIGDGVIMSIHLARRMTRNVKIGNHVSIQTNEIGGMDYFRLTIEDNVVIGSNVRISLGGHNIDSPTYEFFRPSEELIIEEYVWICPEAIILPTVSNIGFGAVVEANSTVIQNVKPMSYVCGAPAIEVRRRKAVHNKLVVESLLGGDFKAYHRARKSNR